MIRLQDIITEITLGSIAPYATQFVWQDDRDWDSGFVTRVNCDGVTVVFEMGSQYSQDGEEYAFAFAMPGSMAGEFTISHGRSHVAGQLSYLRVLRTAGEAILDFCAQYAPDAIDVTGFDTEAGTDLQKTRIYRGLLHANAAKLAAAGYGILDRSGKLYIVRKSAADATGIR